MRLRLIDTGRIWLDGGAMFGVVPKAIWRGLTPADGDNLCPWAMRCLLIETEGRRILVDTGIGDKQGEKFRRRYRLEGKARLIAGLAAAAVEAEAVTDVVFTHLHFDHSGEAVREEEGRLLPTFPNATYWCTASQWQAATQPNARERASFLAENILPLAESGQLRHCDERTDLGDGVRLTVSNGHTDGQVIPHLRYRGRTLVFAADLIPSSWHVPLPFIMAYDLRPLVLLREKEELLAAAAAQGHVICLQHDPKHECCTVAATDRGFRVARAFRLDDL